MFDMDNLTNFRTKANQAANHATVNIIRLLGNDMDYNQHL